MNIILKILHICIVFCFLVPAAEARQKKGEKENVVVTDLAVSRNGDKLFVSMDIDVSSVRKIKTNRELQFTPWLCGEDTLALHPVVLAGRNRYFHHLRNGLAREDTELLRRKDADTVHYRSVIPYEKWMGSAELKLGEVACGCLGKQLSEEAMLLAVLNLEQKTFVPEFVYAAPDSIDYRLRTAEGTAYIDFPVDGTVILEDFRDNSRELMKICSAIDTLQDNTDMEIVSVSIKGYASPDGPFGRNMALAEKRTEALAAYVQDIYSFPDSVMTVEHEAEDWAGFERMVQTSDLKHRDAILEVIRRDDMTPDAKEWRLKVMYKGDYRRILDEIYPSLRRSDYVVTYVIRDYADIEEIRAVMRTANLNAANIAMSEGDFDNALLYITRAGDSPEATYAMGIWLALQKDYERAAVFFSEAGYRGIAEAEGALKQLEAFGIRTETSTDSNNDKL